MLEFCHSLTGAVIATKIGNPLVSLPLSFASNLIIDLLPHWNPHLYTEKQKNSRLSVKTLAFLAIDSLAGLFLGLTIAFSALPDLKKVLIIILACLLAVSFDLAEAPFYLFGWQNKTLKKLIDFQRKHQFNVSFWPGVGFQFLYALVLLGLVGKI